MRLDRCLANSGYGSRSEVKNLIKNGKVSVDGQLVRDSGWPVDEHRLPDIRVSGQPIRMLRQVHLMLNKPAGLITALDDPKHRTIAELIPLQMRQAGLFPIGRLDRDVTGLLLLTNDGTLCHRLASPRWQVLKTYELTARGREFDADDIAAFAVGLVLSDGQHCRPAELRILGPLHALLTIHEGKYHQVKRMMLGTGRRVCELRRLSVGPVVLDDKLAPGECRELTDDEIIQLYDLVSLKPE